MWPHVMMKIHVGGPLRAVAVGGSFGAMAAGESSWRLSEDDLGRRARHSAMTGEHVGPRRYQRGSVVESARLWGEARGEVEAAMV